MMSSNWKPVFKFDTTYPADSVEWCPIEPFLDYFVCSTYLLLEDNIPAEEKRNQQDRIGRIYLLKIKQDGVEVVQNIDCKGILDMKWCPTRYEEKIHLGVVTANGEINIFQLQDLKLVLTSSVNLLSDEEGDYMTLALNWSNHFNHQANICVTDNKGNAAILNYCRGILSIEEKWSAHSLEAWTVAFDVQDLNVLYTGGDDAKLKIWDRRIGTAQQRLVINNENSGVTIIQPNTDRPNSVLVGSFDEILNFYDSRSFKCPMYQVQSSGGLWRVKCLRNYILSANIYGGFQILDFSNTPKVVATYKEHKSLAYGADWSFLEEKRVSGMFKVNQNGFLVATCSFYDHLLTISTWEP